MDNICFCSFREMIDRTLDILYNKEPELFNIDSSDEIEAHVGERAFVFVLDCIFNKHLMSVVSLKITIWIVNIIEMELARKRYQW